MAVSIDSDMTLLGVCAAVPINTSLPASNLCSVHRLKTAIAADGKSRSKVVQPACIQSGSWRACILQGIQYHPGICSAAKHHTATIVRRGIGSTLRHCVENGYALLNTLLGLFPICLCTFVVVQEPTAQCDLPTFAAVERIWQRL